MGARHTPPVGVAVANAGLLRRQSFEVCSKMAVAHDSGGLPGVGGGPPRRRRDIHGVNLVRRILFGQPIQTAHQEHARLPKWIALPVFSSDPISSVAYATQQILLVLGAAGLWTLNHQATYTKLTLGITLAIVLLSIIVVTSYRQTIYAYPFGGGSYIVSKDNLGVGAGLVAAAAILIDYILTVSVSIASGVQNLLSTPIMSRFQGDQVPVCLVFVVALMLVNLRGLKESGMVFATPTYSFITMALVMIGLGIFGPFLGWQVQRTAVNHTIPEFARGPATSLVGIALIGIILKAFASGCAALTGTEAVADGVPAFRKPESRNAAATLFIMACILATLFTGISWLATSLHVVYWEAGGQASRPVIDQLSSAVFGKTGSPLRVGLYYAMQITTAAILVLAANTSYADFPRLSSILARDRFLPRQLANRADKLVFANGIVLLSIFAMVLIVSFHGSVDRLIPLYALGVFTAFTFSQAGMVKRWVKQRGKGWLFKAVVNGIGATCTGIVLAIIGIEKGPQGAWIVVVVAGVLIALFVGISRHYAYVRKQLSLVDYRPDPTPLTNTVILLAPGVHRGIFPALEYARSLSPDCRAIHIEMEPEETPRLRKEWEQYVGDDIPLVILPSPYRSLIGPLLAYLDEVQKERAHHVVTVVVPEFVSRHWWHGLLHNVNGLLVKLYLLGRPGIIVTNVRYFLDAESAEAAGQGPSAQ